MKIKTKNQNRKTGFTLVELLLYVGISSTLLLVTSLFLGMMLEARVKNQTISEVEGQGAQVMQTITQNIRNAQNITSPSVGASGASLTLDVVNIARDPTIFDLASGVVRIKEGSGAYIPLTNSHVVVSGLNFANLSRPSTPGVVRVSFTVTYVNPEGRKEYDFSQTFYSSTSLRQ